MSLSYPTLIVKSEQYISDREKLNILKKQVKSINDNSMWYNEALCKKETFGKGCECEKSLNFIIDTLNKTKEEKVIDFCVGVLSGFSNINSKKNEISSLLKDLLKSAFHSNIKKNILICLAKLKIDTKDDEKYLITNYINSEDPNIRIGMLEYLSYTNKLNEHTEIVTNIIEAYIKYRNTNDFAISEMLKLKNRICKISNFNSLIKIIDSLTKISESICIESKVFIDVLNELLSQLAKISKEKDNDILYYSCFLLFKQLCASYNNDACITIVKLFDNFGLLEKLVYDLLKNPDEGIFSHIHLIIEYKNETIEIVCNAYNNGLIETKNIIENLAYSYRDNNLIFDRLNDCYYKNNGHIIILNSIVNYSEVRRKDAQSYCNALSDITKLSFLVDKLLKYYKNNELTYGELVNLDYYSDMHENGLTHLIQTILSFNFENSFKINNFIPTISSNFDCFQLNEFYTFINTKEIKICDDTKQSLINNSIKYLEKYNLHEVYVEDENRGRINISVVRSLSILMKISTTIPADILFGAIEIPYIFFNLSSIDEKYEILENRLGKDVIIDKIKDLTERETRVSLLDEYYYIFNKYRIEGYKEKAIDICLNTKKELARKNNIINYVISVYGIREYINQIIYNCQNETIIDLLYRINEEEYENLSNEIIKRYAHDKLPEFTKYLLTRNNYRALNYLYRKLKKQNGILDDDSTFDLIATIGKITSIKLLPLLFKLTILSNRNAFTDREVFSLKNELMSAYVNCSKSNYRLTITVVKILRYHFRISKNNQGIAYCSYYLNCIYDSRRKTYSDEEIMHYLDI